MFIALATGDNVIGICFPDFAKKLVRFIKEL